MTRVELLDLVVRLGREFARREMTVHVDQLRGAFRSLRAGGGWPSGLSEEWLVDWARTLRLSPFDGSLGFPVRGRTEPCPCGVAWVASTTVTRSWPGGYRARCTGCGREAVVLTDA